jgi:hypothetical protein
LATEPEFDSDAAHRFFSANCFNKAWDLIDKPSRTLEEDEEMIRLSLASIWHWTQRKDHTRINLSVGYWQLSRIYTLLQQPENARHYALLSLNLLPSDEALPFYRAYAYEALARAELVAGDIIKQAEYRDKALQLAEDVADPEDKQQLLRDLETMTSRDK